MPVPDIYMLVGIHTFIRTYIYMYVHIYAHLDRQSYIQVNIKTVIPTSRYADIYTVRQAYRQTNIRIGT